MGSGVDTATAVNSTTVNTIKNAGYTFIGRYLTGAFAMTSSEAHIISNAGLYIVSIFEIGNSPSYFTSNQGTTDATNAVNAANNLNQTSGTPIYFAVDNNTISASALVPYFQAIVAVLSSASANPNGYIFGIYGSPNVCAYFRGTYSPTQRYTWTVSTWPGTFSDWNLQQNGNALGTILGSGTGKITVDLDTSSSYGGGGWKF